MPRISQTISTYIQAKDTNRPWLMRNAFTNDAMLEMAVNSDAISFPPSVSGVEGITETLIRQFASENENVYTFCLTEAPDYYASRFECGWLVGMSKRDTGEVRVGCGQYRWSFDEKPIVRATRLVIEIEHMLVLDSEHLEPVMRWLSGLAYPWCPAISAAADIPDIDGLNEVSEFLTKHS